MTSFNPRLTGKVNLNGLRFAQGSVNRAGRYSKGTSTPLNFKANHQPLNGKELLLLPEGEREKRTKKLYTAFELRGVDIENKISADEIIIGSEIYKVFNVKPYSMGVLDHFKVIVIRKDK